ncbi:alpha-1,3-mannosyl-glycoprotein 4-beta-N-acetylglucosaminyltransferase A-like [Saccostrea echinata]|uniref:alpha-1,3-mannosyl-glycoprotein 4-beta-N-acetylglucosaminyltransferase A-like n=1 Tax=Saccostrea echinata TaxID=191078 RepID=UPI002A82513C|nr:alpha-1,3-mannosyl-glycoprotein 4-beta-N-acetylglucosaminyltransferase A-like [Saccostrea echinata]
MSSRLECKQKMPRRFWIKQPLLLIPVFVIFHCIVLLMVIGCTQHYCPNHWIKGNGYKDKHNEVAVMEMRGLNKGKKPAEKVKRKQYWPTESSRTMTYDEKIEEYLSARRGKALLYGVFRQYKGYLTIAIPAKKRSDESIRFVEQTLDSLIENTYWKDFQKIVVVVFLLSDDTAWCQTVGRMLYEKYKEKIDSGFVQVAYRGRNVLSKLLPLQENESSQEKQRREENLSFLNIVTYGKNFSSYLLLLDEDVLCEKDYFIKILGFIHQQTKPNRIWFVLNFSRSSLMGQLVRTSDLMKVIKLLIILRYDLSYGSLIEFMTDLKGQQKRYRMQLFRYFNFDMESFLPKKFTRP